MGASNSSQSSNKFFTLKAKADATNKPHFVQSVKKPDGKWGPADETFDTMSGTIEDAYSEEKEFVKGVKETVFILVMKDETDTMKITLTHNQTTYSIINSLSSNPQPLSNYTISVYKKEGNNGKFYGAAAVKENGQKTEWAIDPKSAPRGEKLLKADGSDYLVNGKQVFDDSKVKAFWLELFNTKVKKAFNTEARRAGIPGMASSAPTSTSSQAAGGSNNDNDDLPF